MKRCPACQSTYTDETLLYCLQDGVPLEGPEPEDEEAETVIRQNIPEAVTVQIASEPATEETRPAELTHSGSASDEKPRTVVAVLATIAAMLILFGVIGLAGYFYISSDGSGASVASNTGNGPANANGTESANTDPDSSPSTKPTVKPTITPTPIPTPPLDLEKIKKSAADLVYNWVSLAEARNLGPYMAMYGDRIDYYNKRGATRSFVRNDKRKAFTKNDSIKIELSKMSVTPAKDGKSATAVFDKEFKFTAGAKVTSGKVRSRLVLRRSGNRWKIVSERDLKVYYVNK